MARTRITLLGGVNEIGGNKFLLEEGENRLLLDFGTSLGARGLFFEEFLTPRTNSVLRDLFRLHLLPDVDGIYREDFLTIARAATDRDLPESAAEYRKRHGRDFVDGVLLTHAHVDHYQDLSFVDPDIPVYCTPTTRRMLEAIEDLTNADAEKEVARVRRRALGRTGARSTFPDRPTVNLQHGERTLREIGDGAVAQVGAFHVQAIPVDHSVPGACAFLVRTPAGKRVLYTGDVRFHGRLTDRTATLLKTVENLEPDVMLCEGTRMDSDHSDNEADVSRGVHGLVKDAPGLVVTEFGWKDTTRFDTLQRVAEASGRTLLVDARLAYLLHRLHDRSDVPSGRVEDYDNVRVYVRRRGTLLDEPHDYAKHEAGYDVTWDSKRMRDATDAGDEGFLDHALAHYRHGVRAREVHEHPDRYMVHLTFWSSSELFDIIPPEGSRWIRCATEPFSDEMALNVERQRSWLDHFGLDHNLPAGKGDAGILKGTTHVSGHGARPDLERLIRRANPKLLVPVHTAEKALDRFEDLRRPLWVRRGATFRHAARKECSLEL